MPNQLIREQSPYLLQHAHNPVDWHPWGDAAFAEAAAQNKPVIVSIGYAACHWCHVMERESFENPEVAAFMNAHFVCIKVDREEHPAVDALYMDAVQAISGSGGWPLNAFVTPDRVPFYGGTYFPPQPAYGRPSWMQLLERMSAVWRDSPDDVRAQTEQMQQYLRQTGAAPGAAGEREANAADCRKMAGALLAAADREWGGFGGAPKFPGTMAISFLLEQDLFAGNAEARQHALHSLDAMMAGGIYDQLGGGFARYSTDREWLAPHFEKMLYDNALLVLSLCDGYAASGDERYRRCIEETVAFCNRELRDPSGGFYSALDADSEGMEGKFYTWTAAEWRTAMEDDPDEALAARHFGVLEEGNWEHTNILHLAVPVKELAAESGLSEETVNQRIGRVLEKLFLIRAGRVRPQTDDKCLLSWNALMNVALSRAGLALEREDYIRQAGEHADWMLAAFGRGEHLLHTWKAGQARITANLDDHAYLIQALLQLSAATGEDRWLAAATEQTGAALSGFSDAEGCFFYLSSEKSSDIPVRKIDLYDGATPSANAVMAHNLILLGLAAARPEWTGRGRSMLRRAAGATLRYPQSFGYWAQLVQRTVRGWHTSHCSGAASNDNQRWLAQQWLPHHLALPADTGVTEIAKGALSGGKEGILVCNEWACLPPLSEKEAVAKLLAPLLTDA